MAMRKLIHNFAQHSHHAKNFCRWDTRLACRVRGASRRPALVCGRHSALRTTSAIGLGVLLLVLAIGFRGIAAAQEGQEKKAEGDKEKGTKQGAVLNPATAKRLNEAVEQIHAQHYGDAKEALGKLDLDKLSPYE